MKTRKIENTLVVLLFFLVLVVFSFADRDSKKLDRLYKTVQLLQKDQPAPTVQLPPASLKTNDN